jgi:hypothetical protein
LRAEDIPYSSDKSIKEKIEDVVSNISGINESGVLTAQNIKFPYSGGELGPFTNVDSALRAVLYTPVIGEISVTDGGIFENGQILNSLYLEWEFNKPIESQILNQGIGSLDKAIRNYTHIDIEVSTPITYQLTVTHEGNNVGYISKDVLFTDRRYCGSSIYENINDNQIRTLLSGELVFDRSKSFITSGNNSYVYICYPSSWGQSTIAVNGIDTDFQLESRLFTNQFGYEREYYIYRSLYKIGGLVSVNIK